MPDNIGRRIDIINSFALDARNEANTPELVRRMRLNLLEYEKKAQNIRSLLDNFVRLDQELDLIESFFVAIEDVLANLEPTDKREKTLLEFARNLSKDLLVRIKSQTEAQKNKAFTSANISDVERCIQHGDEVLAELEEYLNSKN